MPTPLARWPFDYCDCDLGRPLVHEALTVNGLREEPVPDQADALTFVLGDERRVTGATPPLVEHRELREAEQNGLGRQPSVGVPRKGDVEHLA